MTSKRYIKDFVSQPGTDKWFRKLSAIQLEDFKILEKSFLTLTRIKYLINF